MRQRTEAHNIICKESHVANNLALQIPAQQGPAIAVASVVAVSFSEASGAAGAIVLASAFLLICSAGLSFMLIFKKYDLLVNIVEHVDRSKMNFARGQISISGLYYTRGHLFKGFNRFLILSSAFLYLSGILGVAAGFGIHFFTLGRIVS